MIHSKSPDEYYALKEQFYKIETSEIKHKYFISPKWEGFYRNILPTFNWNASSRVEGVNSKVKPFIPAALLEFFDT